MRENDKKEKKKKANKPRGVRIQGELDENGTLLTERCNLCHRSRPVFAGDEQLKRLPDRSLTQFLRQLKQDVINNASYIKMLRLNSRFIQACNCDKDQVHSYCKTVQVL